MGCCFCRSTLILFVRVHFATEFKWINDEMLNRSSNRRFGYRKKESTQFYRKKKHLRSEKYLKYDSKVKVLFQLLHSSKGKKVMVKKYI